MADYVRRAKEAGVSMDALKKEMNGLLAKMVRNSKGHGCNF